MENVSKALVMAGGVLIGVMILTLAVYLFIDFGTTSAEINAQNTQKQIVEFNSKFTSYSDKEVTIYDVITVANYAIENNKYYEDLKKLDEEAYLNEYKITVMFNSDDLTDTMDENKLMEENKNLITKTSPSLPKYKCNSDYIEYHENGRVKCLRFSVIK